MLGVESLKINGPNHGRQVACLVASGKISGFSGKTPDGHDVSIKLIKGEEGSVVCLQAGNEKVEFPVIKGNGFKSNRLFLNFTGRRFRVPKGN